MTKKKLLEILHDMRIEEFKIMTIAKQNAESGGPKQAVTRAMERMMALDEAIERLNRRKCQ